MLLLENEEQNYDVESVNKLFPHLVSWPPVVPFTNMD